MVALAHPSHKNAVPGEILVLGLRHHPYPADFKLGRPCSAQFFDNNRIARLICDHIPFRPTHSKRVFKEINDREIDVAFELNPGFRHFPLAGFDVAVNHRRNKGKQKLPILQIFTLRHLHARNEPQVKLQLRRRLTDLRR